MEREIRKLQDLPDSNEMSHAEVRRFLNPPENRPMVRTRRRFRPTAASVRISCPQPNGLPSIGS